MEPARLGPYRLGRRLAAGGMAEVFAATREGAAGFEKQVALKRILPHLVDDPELVEMFLDEARLASKLTHANVAQVFDFGEADGSFFIVMEWIRGKDLRRVMRAAAEAGVAVTPVQAALVGQGVARALACAHGLEDDHGRPLGLVHRDVSPQNVLVSFDGEVKLTDFGIAKIATGRSRTAVGVIKGKCAYMSPEQARGEALDGRTDLFALGVVLWELLAGQPLFTGRSDPEILRAVERFEAPPLRSVRPEVPADLEAVVVRALGKDPAGRFATAGRMAAALGDVVLAHAGSSEALDLGALMRRLFPEEAAGRRPGTGRLPRPGAGDAAAAGDGGPGDGVRPPRSVPTPPEPGDTRAEGLRANEVPASPRSSETAALEAGDAGAGPAAALPPRRWRTPALLSGAVLLAAGITWALAQDVPASQGAGSHNGARPPAAAASPNPAPTMPAPAAPRAAPHPARQPATPTARSLPRARPTAAAAPHRRRRRAAHRRAHPQARSPRARGTHPPATHAPAAAAPPPTPAVQVLGPAPGAPPHATAAPAATSLRAGTLLAARLDAGANSTGRQPASARLVRSVIRAGRVILPRGTRLLGRATAAGDRLAVRFTRVILPGGAGHPLKGTALGADGRAGLPVPDAVTETGGHRVLALPAGTDLSVRLDTALSLPTTPGP